MKEENSEIVQRMVEQFDQTRQKLSELIERDVDDEIAADATKYLLQNLALNLSVIKDKARDFLYPSQDKITETIKTGESSLRKPIVGNRYEYMDHIVKITHINPYSSTDTSGRTTEKYEVTVESKWGSSSIVDFDELSEMG